MNIATRLSGGDRHPTFFGEFQRVRNQILEDMPALVGITGDGGQGGSHFVDQGDTFFPGQGFEHGGDLAGQATEGETTEVDFLAAGLDTREVEDIVDQGQEVFAVALDDLEIAVFLFGDGLGQSTVQQAGQNDHGVQRRARLVAHIREKGALQPVGLVQLLLLHLEFAVLFRSSRQLRQRGLDPLEQEPGDDHRQEQNGDRHAAQLTVDGYALPLGLPVELIAPVPGEIAYPVDMVNQGFGVGAPYSIVFDAIERFFFSGFMGHLFMLAHG